MTDGSIFSVEIHGVALVDALEDFGKRNVLGFDQEMNMVAHENVCVEMVAIAVFLNGQKLKASLKIGGIFEYFLSLITAGDDVVEGAVKLYPWFSRHDESLSEERELVKMAIFKSDPPRLNK